MAPVRPVARSGKVLLRKVNRLSDFSKNTHLLSAPPPDDGVNGYTDLSAFVMAGPLGPCRHGQWVWQPCAVGRLRICGAEPPQGLGGYTEKVGAGRQEKGFTGPEGRKMTGRHDA